MAQNPFKLTGQIVLPLLSSLSPETTKPIVHNLLKQCAAQRTIRKFLIRHIRRIRNNKNREAEIKVTTAYASTSTSNRSVAEKKAQSTKSKKSKTKSKNIAEKSTEGGSNNRSSLLAWRCRRSTAQLRPVPAAQHFMLRALQSESLTIRQHSSLQLLHAADNPLRVGILVDVLWDIIREEMDAFFSSFPDVYGHERGHAHGDNNAYTNGDGDEYDFDNGEIDGADQEKKDDTHLNSNNNTKAAVMDSEGILQLYGLLAHYVTQDNDQFYPFLLKGGLDWICDKILSLVHLLMICKGVNETDQQFGVRNTASNPIVVNTGGVREEEKIANDPDSDIDASPKCKTSAASTQKPTLNKHTFTFASPSIYKPRHYFTAVAQSNIMIFPYRSEEGIKRRIYILVDLCLRMTVLAADTKWKERHEGVLNWLWKREIDVDRDRKLSQHGFHEDTVSATEKENLVKDDRISPLGCLLAASLILRKSDNVTTSNSNTGASTEQSNSVGSVLTGEDYILMPEKKVDRINWMLARMTDVHAEVMVVCKEKEKNAKDKEKKADTAVSSSSGTLKKRKREDRTSLSSRSGDAPGSSDTANASEDAGEILSRLVKRQRSSTSNSSSTARAIMRAVGSSNERSTLGHSDGFSSAAEVMARTLSILDRGRDDAEGSGSGGAASQSLSSSLGRFMEFRMGLGGGEDENENNDQYGNGEEEGGEENEEKDEPNDDEDDRHFHVEQDEEIESDVQMEEIDEDEEIESDDEEDGDDDEDDEDDEDGEEDRDEEGQLLDNIIVEVGSNPFQDDHLMMVDELENVRSMSSLHRPLVDSLRQRSPSDGSSPGSKSNHDTQSWRSKSYIHAGIEIMEAQYPNFHHLHHKSRQESSSNRSYRNKLLGDAILTPSAEQALVQSICDVVRPPKKPLKLKVFMRRAPTQEEFFRGSLSQNPILISSLKTEQGSSSNSSNNEPKVKDLRQRIANELQMGDSAELLELLVANKILDMNLKLRVVAQTEWRNHLLENASTVHSENSFRQYMSGTSLSESGLLSRARFDENTPISSLPPMVVTYRLAGVDGEATEDTVAEGDLIDPDAPPDTNTTSQEYEKKMEKEFGITRMITRGRGVSVLLRSLEAHLGQTMKRIRRDDIGRTSLIGGIQFFKKNPSRTLFLKSPPCPSLTLLQHCAMLADNRKKMINAQAPTVLLRLLLDVLNSIDQSPKSKNELKRNFISASDDGVDSTATLSTGNPPNQKNLVGNNPTSDALQELIETLSSDISAEMTKKSTAIICDDVEINSNCSRDSDGSEESTLPMLLSSLRTTSLSPPLRKVIAKLLPFLTYGQLTQSRALASQFLSHIHVDYLGSDSSLYASRNGDNKAVLMETFVDAAIHLPPAAVCDTLRSELIRQGFVRRINELILSKIPSTPPPWSPALYAKGEKLIEGDKGIQRREWKIYYNRSGLQTAFKILIGLSTEHCETQTYLSSCMSTKTSQDKNASIYLVTAAHWIESTSDNDDIKTNGLGILAETLLDTMLYQNEEVKAKISSLRRKTRNRKKELALDRRKKALSGMSAFGRLVGDGASKESFNPKVIAASSTKRKSSKLLSSQTISKSKSADKVSINKPSWMLEMEAMEDERGLTCAVCQEGRNYQPSEMLGLYAFMKKVSIPNSKGGARGAADGSLMVLSIPPSRLLPESLRDSDADIEWYQPSVDLAALLKATPYGASVASSSSSVTGSRSSFSLITTVTAGNAIHCTCHIRARTADRNHPKAPKTEWEGASLRNSRVSCNIILPLISKENSKVPVMAMENCLADHQQAISNMLGSKPKSMLWIVLHDLRLLLLRISYGEALNVDCGGGSLSSNANLIFHLLFLAHMFARDAEHDAPVTVRHAKGLSTAYLAASSIIRANDVFDNSQMKKMRKGFADAGPMAAICCILFQNSMNEEEVLSSMNDLSSEGSPSAPPPKRRFEVHKDHFLAGLLQCAGRRYSLGINGSGCGTSSSGRRMRSSSFSDWNDDSPTLSGRRPIGKRSGLAIEDYAKALRPMVIFYAVLHQMSKVFTIDMDDEKIEACSERVVGVIESCQKAEDIRSLISLANITLDDTSIVEELESGMNTVL